MSPEQRQVAIAIIHQNQQFLLQLRDDLPHILYPGQWSVFGGHLDPHESPEAGIRREIWEEITYNMDRVELFGLYEDETVRRYVFTAPLTLPFSELRQTEGQDMVLAPASVIESGYCYSPKVGEYRPFAPIHRKILLDFLKARVK